MWLLIAALLLFMLACACLVGYALARVAALDEEIRRLSWEEEVRKWC